VVPVKDNDLHLRCGKQNNLDVAEPHTWVYRVAFASGETPPVPPAKQEWTEPAPEGGAWYVAAVSEAQAVTHAPQPHEVERVARNVQQPVRLHLQHMGEVMAFLVAHKLQLPLAEVPGTWGTHVAVHPDSVTRVFEALTWAIALTRRPGGTTDVTDAETLDTEARTMVSLVEIMMGTYNCSHFPTVRPEATTTIAGKTLKNKKFFMGNVCKRARSEGPPPLLLASTFRWGTEPIVTLRQLLSAAPEAFDPRCTYEVESHLYLRERMALQQRWSWLCQYARSGASTGRQTLALWLRTGSRLRRDQKKRIQARASPAP
jgi:hypothetical protein